jgi:hypothetical protein
MFTVQEELVGKTIHFFGRRRVFQYLNRKTLKLKLMCMSNTQESTQLLYAFNNRGRHHIRGINVVRSGHMCWIVAAERLRSFSWSTDCDDPDRPLQVP